MSKKTLGIGFLVYSFLLSFVYAQEEKITITTYYPSPYGSYRELRSQRMAIGETYINHSDVCWEGDTGCSGSPMIPSANDVDLIVQGNVGIGTTTPGAMLQIGDTGFNNGSYNLRVTKGSAAGAFDGSYATELRSYTGGSGSMGVLIHHQETVANRHILDISNANGIVASFNGNGNVGIGTTGPDEKLEVKGNIKLSGSSPTYKMTNVIVPTEDSDVATKGYVDALAGGGGAFQISCGWITTGLPPGVGSCNPSSCPSGYASSNVGCRVTSIASGGAMFLSTWSYAGAPNFGTSSGYDRTSKAGAAGECYRNCYKQ